MRVHMRVHMRMHNSHHVTAGLSELGLSHNQNAQDIVLGHCLLHSMIWIKINQIITDFTEEESKTIEGS